MGILPQFKHLPISWVNSILIILGLQTIAQATSFVEIGDAGTFPTPTFAQVAEVGSEETFDSIRGTFQNWYDIDIFQVELEAGLFSASTQDGINLSSVSLFLFDSNGLGLAANTGNGTVAALEGILSETGTYFLGIGSGLKYRWLSDEGIIFSESDLATSQFGTTGIGAAFAPSAVARSGSVEFSDYEIFLENTNSQNRQQVPEPWFVPTLLLVGILGIIKGHTQA